MKRRKFLELLASTALGSAVGVPVTAPRSGYCEFPRHGTGGLGPFVETTIATTWYMEDGRVLEFPGEPDGAWLDGAGREDVFKQPISSPAWFRYCTKGL